MREKHRTTPLWLKVLIPILGIGSLGVVAVTGAVLAFVITAWLGQPIPVLGFDQSVEQPIPFPHTIHAGMSTYTDSTGGQVQGLGMDCTFCHRTVTSQANAGVPPVQFCAYCHQVIGGEDSAPLTQVRMAAGIIGDEPIRSIGNVCTGCRTMSDLLMNRTSDISQTIPRQSPTARAA